MDSVGRAGEPLNFSILSFNDSQITPHNQFAQSYQISIESSNWK